MRALIVAAWLVIAGAGTARAQVPAPQPRQPQPSDTVKVPPFRVQPPVSPMGAMWRSLVLPGWGQAILDRRATATWFIFFEGITMVMTIKSLHQLDYQEAIGAPTVDDKRQEVQDWAVLWVFNHLLAAAEAFVSANLWDFPADLESRQLPSRDVGMGIGIRF